MRLLRIEPDVAAVAVLALAMLAPAAVAGRSSRAAEPIRLRPAAYGDIEWSKNPDAMAGFDEILEWTSAMEKKGERVWDRLSERMRRFEERFEKHSVRRQQLRDITCESDSE
jgi:hypothetical protein